jgi:hypothetical protein
MIKIIFYFSISEFEHKKRGIYVLEQVLPVLLNDGLYNKNEDIAKFSLNTISKSFLFLIILQFENLFFSRNNSLR